MILRAAQPSDIPALLDITVKGFDTYRDFAPPGWRMPDFESLGERVIDEEAWWWVAAGEGGDPVGHALMIPAARSREPVDDPRLGHVMQLFVLPSHWGTGVARALHEAMVEEAPRRGFDELRLFTPSGQRRARAFYERERWRPLRELDDTALGFPVVEYRRACPIPS
ncbi:MAG TPA: GNAT family N-acetyltransferase [Solirubrobacteraceae bacterium]